MPLEFDNIQINLYDHETDEDCTYNMGAMPGDDYTSPEEYMDKLYSDNSLKEIKDKMAELEQPKSNQKKGAGKKGKGGIGGFMKKIVPMAGKALGTAFFGPIGGAVGGIAGGALSGAMGGKSASGAKGATSKQDYQDSRQMMMEELKNMMQKLQQMQQALSNVLNSMHQGAMNSIRNIRA